jgi:hypothetical protein
VIYWFPNLLFKFILYRYTTAPGTFTRDVTLAEDGAAVIHLDGADADGDAVHVVVTRPPPAAHGYLAFLGPAAADGSGAVVVGAALPAHTRVPLGAVAFKGVDGFNGATSFEYVVDDGRLRSAPATVEQYKLHTVYPQLDSTWFQPLNSRRQRRGEPIK